MLLVTRFVSVVKGKEEWSFILKNFFSMEELGQQLVLFYDLSNFDNGKTLAACSFILGVSPLGFRQLPEKTEN